ncbi:MAG TPA: hypothetical protein VGO80_06490 [Solirubrobacteraceae bacterium]|jgi:hypothetical protein|nr:hypothetical protein [Solirubrobacteraceae bacterium]
MSPSRYVADAKGLRYHWATSPAFECPNADALVYTAAEDGDGEGTWMLRPATADAITAAAVVLGADALLLARILRSRHQAQGVQRLRVDEKLTDRCGVCGARMRRKGFKAWITEPSTDTSQKRIASRLGMTAPRETVRTTWHDTQKAARTWAEHERGRAAAAQKRR